MGKNKDFCGVVMLSEGTSRANNKNMDRCKNCLDKSSAAKVSEHIQWVFLMSRTSSFKDIKDKNEVKIAWKSSVNT